MQIQVRADVLDAYRAELPGGVRGPARVQVTATPNGSDLRLQVDLTVELRADRYEVSDMRVRQVDGGPAVDSAALRAVPVADIVARALRPFVLVGGRGEVDLGGVTPQPLRVGPDVAANGPTDDALRQVAAVYSLALMIGAPPTQTVAEQFGIKRATVGRWVMRCRDRGFLPPTTPGKAG